MLFAMLLIFISMKNHLKTNQFSIRLDDDQARRLEQASDKIGKSQTQIIRQAIGELLLALNYKNEYDNWDTQFVMLKEWVDSKITYDEDELHTGRHILNEFGIDPDDPDQIIEITGTREEFINFILSVIRMVNGCNYRSGRG
jgi:predicted transcriptional regulator